MLAKTCTLLQVRGLLRLEIAEGIMQDVYDRVTLEGRFCFGVDNNIPRFALRHGFLSSGAIVFFSPPDTTKPVLMTPHTVRSERSWREIENRWT